MGVGGGGGDDKLASDHRLVHWERQELSSGRRLPRSPTRASLPRKAAIPPPAGIAGLGGSTGCPSGQTPCYDWVHLFLYLAKCVVPFEQGSCKCDLFNTG